MSVTEGRPPRRVVTGIGDDGRSCVMIDEPVRMVADGPVTGGLVWRAPSLPAPDSHATDAAAGGFSLGLMGAGGANMTVFEIAPGDPPPLYAYPTIDCIVVLRGRIELFTEAGSTVLETGDLLVDRGVPHAMRALDGKAATTLVVNLPAEPQS